MKNNIKFIRNIVITLIALLLVAAIINFTPGYKRDKYADVTNLVFGGENITEYLTYQIYLKETGSIYVSKKDIEDLILEKIKEDEVNFSDVITKKEGVEYINLSDIASRYELQTEYIEESNTVIIDDRETTIKIAKITEDVNLQFKPRKLSKVVTELKDGEEVTCFDNVINGWRLIRTSLGKIGYIEENKLIVE